MSDDKNLSSVPATEAVDNKEHIDVSAAAADDSAPPTYRSLPNGWMYKTFRVGRHELWFASPKIQLLMISFVCFLCPGMFNALAGLGGGGTDDDSANSKTNTALYSTFAAVGFFAGTITNRLGLRLALSFGGIGYCVYSAAFLCWNHTFNEGFIIFAGALLGVCAGLLWCAQGAIMMSYPPEESKGRYISFFWIIFNLGAVLGSLVRELSFFSFSCSYPLLTY